MGKSSKICGRSGCNTTVTRVSPRTGKLSWYCDLHLKEKKRYANTYFQKNREQQNRVTLENYHKLRRAVLDLYSHTCVCCGVEGDAFLALDHVQNDGKEHRAARGKHGVYRDALATYRPDRFQVLCHNCNIAKSMNDGVCPHQLASLGEKSYE